MKTIIIALAFAFAVASPALAHQNGGGNHGGNHGNHQGMHNGNNGGQHGFRGGRDRRGGYGPDNCGVWYGGLFISQPCY
jgi:uncharacterized membrane protein